MSNEYTLKITEEVTAHFNTVLLNSKYIDGDKAVGSAKKSLARFQKKSLDAYVVEHMATLEKMVKMLSDNSWKTSETDKKFILSALQYFADEEDLIPDDVPKVGLLDDCIMIDIVEQQVKEKLLAYNEYVEAKSIYGNNEKYSTEDWANTKRKELFSRLRHRRIRSKRTSRGTSFSIG